MENMRQWELGATAPYVLQLAADARSSRTNHLNDQTWELSLGLGDSPALVLQSRYGGRVGLASLVPMWRHEGRTIYQAQTYARPPIITAVAPGYVQIQARLTPEIAFTVEYWVMESQAVGGRFSVKNIGKQAVTIHLDLFGHVGSDDKELPLAILTLVDETHALSMGRLRGLEPVVVLDGAVASIPSGTSGTKASPKIGLEMSLEPGEERLKRWVHAGLGRMMNSLERAQFWLSQDWQAAFEQIALSAQAIPTVETGNVDYDTVIAFSYQQLVQAFHEPTEHLPYASFIASRQPDKGYTRRGDGTDFDRGWSGQNPHLAYLVATGMASVHPEFAKGVIQNYLAVQTDDGWIDMKPGLAGQREEVLLPPLLARMTLHVYQLTGDKQFAQDVLPKLMKFFNRWLHSDVDADRDLLPEWQDERQTGYIFWPTFGAGQPWSQNLDIRRVETPDMAAYLLSEAEALHTMADALDEVETRAQLVSHMMTLQGYLQALWSVERGRYTYRDRDTHKAQGATTILEGARADEEQIVALKLETHSRIIIRVIGGTGKVPRASLNIQGLDADGKQITEEVDLKDFFWSYGLGVYTSRETYSQVDRIKFEGLSRVYRVNAATVDLTRLDINSVLPLIVPSLEDEQRDKLVELLLSQEKFLRPSGVTIVAADDPNFDPSSARGGGGTWSYWTALIGEGLIAHGRPAAAADLLKRLLDVQVEVVRQQKRFSEFYHSDEPVGLGENGYLSGIIPVHLLLRTLGVQIINQATVWAGGDFVWGEPITVKQHGVTVKRSIAGTEIIFASGQTVKLDPDAAWQRVVDVESVDHDDQTVAPTTPTPPEEPPEPSGTVNRVVIQVDSDDSDDT